MSLGHGAVELLRDIGLFGGLNDEVLANFGGALEVLELEPGAVLFREGECGREMFVVLEGELEVLRSSRRKHEATVAVIGPGRWIGEMSILDVMPRAATVRASVRTRLLRLTAHDLDGLYRRDLKSYALMVLNIAREMSRHLRVAEGLLTELAANMSDEYTRPR